MSSENFVESGIEMGQNKEAPFKRHEKSGHIFDHIVTTRDKNMNFHRQDRIFYEEDARNKMSYEKTPVCLSMFKSHAEVDLIEL